MHMYPVGIKPKPFISYDTSDSNFAELLYYEFSRRGYDSFFAPKSIAPMENWKSAVNKNLLGCWPFVMLLSNAALNSEFATYERNIASFFNKLSVVVQLENCQIPTGHDKYQCFTLTEDGQIPSNEICEFLDDQWNIVPKIANLNHRPNWSAFPSHPNYSAFI